MVCKFELPNGAHSERFLPSNILPDMPIIDNAMYELYYGPDIDICFGGDLDFYRNNSTVASEESDGNSQSPSNKDDDELSPVEDYKTPTPEVVGQPTLNPQLDIENTFRADTQIDSSLPNEENFFGSMFEENTNNNTQERGTKRKRDSSEETDDQ